ncbi:unnamed protein product [Prorocentrum cordatum]|uniref:C3H1-type domain-containing protein n=1 Tax=Prorocentrum cordatum TaxID=2364126 RepID=A0ABN9P9W3_9DINO|nr:unnamed protein product [Polarella glacialis]
MYVSSKTGCIKGQDCQYCHLAHPKKNRPRPCKATRLQCKQLASMLDVLSADAEQMIKATEVLGDNAAYMRTVLRGKQRQLAGEADSRAEAPTGRTTTSSAYDRRAGGPRRWRAHSSAVRTQAGGRGRAA